MKKLILITFLGFLIWLFLYSYNRNEVFVMIDGKTYYTSDFVYFRPLHLYPLNPDLLKKDMKRQFVIYMILKKEAVKTRHSVNELYDTFEQLPPNKRAQAIETYHKELFERANLQFF